MAMPFCKMRPELRAELAATKHAFAQLRRAVEAIQPATRKAASAAQDKAASDLRALDAAYQAATGVKLVAHGDLPAYTGPMFEWRSSRELVAKRAVQAVERLRHRQAGCHPLTAHKARHYFASIWPEGCPWPISTPRPAPFTPKQKGAA